MTRDPSAALSVAMAYYHAWTGKDVDRAMLVEDAPSAECFTVKDGKIVRSLLVFGRTPFDAARRRTT